MRIAQENGGVLRIGKAKPVLINAGLARGQPKNEYRPSAQLMKDGHKFEKGGIPGSRLALVHRHT